MNAKDNFTLYQNIFETEIFLIRNKWFSWHELQQMTYFDFITYSKYIINKQNEENEAILNSEKNSK